MRKTNTITLKYIRITAQQGNNSVGYMHDGVLKVVLIEKASGNAGNKGQDDCIFNYCTATTI